MCSKRTSTCILYWTYSKGRLWIPKKFWQIFFHQTCHRKNTKILFWKQNGVEQSGNFQLTRFISLLRRILGWIHLTTQILLHFGSSLRAAINSFLNVSSVALYAVKTWINLECFHDHVSLFCIHFHWFTTRPPIVFFLHATDIGLSN